MNKQSYVGGGMRGVTDKAGVGVECITVHVHAARVVNGMLQGRIR